MTADQPAPAAHDQVINNRRSLTHNGRHQRTHSQLAKAGGRGPGRGVVHAVDCEEAPAGAPVLTLDRALDAAQHPGTSLCSLCGAAFELDPVLKGFDQGFGKS